MKHRQEQGRFVIRLEKGETFFEPLLRFLAENDIRGGLITGIGGAQWAELGLYNLEDRQYYWKHFDGPLEISNVTGFISVSDSEGIHIHAHATIAGADMNASAGHLKELEVAGTCELVIDPMAEIPRVFNDQIGLGLLELND